MPAQLRAEEIARALGKSTRSGRGFMVCCPAHDDKKPSLYLADGDNGSLVRKCHAGCSTADIDDALERLSLWQRPRREPRTNQDASGRNSAPNVQVMRLVPETAPPPDWKKLFGHTPSKVYTYADADGATRHLIVRFDHSDGGKDIRPLVWARDSAGEHGWTSRAYPTPRPLYGLFDLATKVDKPVLIVEGEKAAIAAGSAMPDRVIITWSGGASAVNKADWLPLKGRDVTLWPDNDDAGREAMAQVAIALKTVGASRVAVVSLPRELPPKWDLADPVPEGVNVVALLADAGAASPGLRAHVLTAQELKRLIVPPRDYIVAPFISTSSLNMIFAARGVGKTWLALSLAIAVSNGDDFLSYAVRAPRTVLYIDGEMALADLKTRVVALDPTDNETLLLLPSERLFMADRPLNINAEDDQKRIEEVIEALAGEGKRPELIVFDNLSSLSTGVDENANSELDSLLKWLITLRHKGLAILLVHHAGKNGDQRGASRREDLLDTSIKLSRPEASRKRRDDDDDGGEDDEFDRSGAYFLLEFVKTRGVRPQPEELKLSLVEGEDSLLVWQTREGEPAKAAEKVLRVIVTKHPHNQNRLAEYAKLTKGAVSQHCKALRNSGYLGDGLEVTRKGRERLVELWPDLEAEFLRQENLPI